MSQTSAKGKAQQLVFEWFATNYPDVPVKFPNAPFSGPDDAMYAEFFWVRGGTGRRSIGSNAYREQVGILQLNIVVPEDTGAGTAETVCEDALNSLNETQHKIGPDETLTFRQAGLDTDEYLNGKYVVIGSIPFSLKKIVRTQAA